MDDGWYIVENLEDNQRSIFKIETQFFGRNSIEQRYAYGIGDDNAHLLENFFQHWKIIRPVDLR